MSKGSGGTRATNSKSAHGGSGKSSQKQGTLTPAQESLKATLSNGLSFKGNWNDYADNEHLGKALNKEFGLKDAEVAGYNRIYTSGDIKKAILSKARELTRSSNSETNTKSSVSTFGVGKSSLVYRTDTTAKNYIVNGKYLVREVHEKNNVISDPGDIAYRTIDTDGQTYYEFYRLSRKYRDKK